MGQQQPVVEKKRFGRYLRKIREERRLSLDAVEEMSLELPERVTKSHLSRIENGQAIPTFPRMFTLSRIYGVPVSHLAERFELCIRAGMFPPDVGAKSIAEVLDDAKRLRVAGRHNDYAPHNMIVGDGTLTLLDFGFFDHDSVVYDLCRFWSHLEQMKMGLLARVSAMATYQSRFLEGYGSPVDTEAPLFRIIRCRSVVASMLTLAENGGRLLSLRPEAGRIYRRQRAWLRRECVLEDG